MRSLMGVVCFAAALLSSTLAQAATIEPVQGDLSVNQGQGFQRVNSRIDANVGDSVMVGPNGAATVVYPDGCTVNVRPGTVVSIAPLSPCASGSFAQEDNSGLNAGTLALGAAVLGATGLIIYGITQSPTSSPASP